MVTLGLIAGAGRLPMVVADVIRVSNRFAGPLVRLRRSMRALARGEHVEPIHFRKGDFWQEFAEEFNAVAARVQGERPNAEPTLREEEATASESVPSEELEPVAVD